MLTIAYPVIDPVAVAIGPVQIRWYALAYLAGFIIGWRYCLYLARFDDRPPGRADIDEFLTWAIIGTIIGGRLGYVLFYNTDYYLQHPLEALMVWRGGMAFHGGLIGVIAAILGFCWRRGISPFDLGDFVAPAAPVGLFFGRIANFINGELYGRPSDLPWAMVFPGGGDAPRHPSQLYEALLEGLVLFVILAVLVHRPGVRRRPGLIGGVFLTGYGIARFVVEYARSPDPQLAWLVDRYAVSMGQLLCLPMVAIGLWLIVRSYRCAPRPAGETGGP